MNNDTHLLMRNGLVDRVHELLVSYVGQDLMKYLPEEAAVSFMRETLNSLENARALASKREWHERGVKILKGEAGASDPAKSTKE